MKATQVNGIEVTLGSGSKLVRLYATSDKSRFFAVIEKGDSHYVIEESVVVEYPDRTTTDEVCEDVEGTIELLNTLDRFDYKETQLSDARIFLKAI